MNGVKDYQNILFIRQLLYLIIYLTPFIVIYRTSTFPL